MSRLSPKARLHLERAILWLLLLSPLAAISLDFVRSELGANPVEAMTHRTGSWALRILLVSLAITPARILFGWRRPLVFRRLIGLFAFFYALVHFSIYLVFDQEFDFSGTTADIAKRPYITVGFAALLILLPLAITSTAKMSKRLGAKRWRRLHQSVYFAAILGVLHFLWLVKADTREPLSYAAVLAILLGVRFVSTLARRDARCHSVCQ